MAQLTELDYEAIENAVMETARGRWFLTEHKKRHGSSDTPQILSAIDRLQKVMTAINEGNENSVPTLPSVPEIKKPVAAAPAPPAFTPAVVDIPGSNSPAVDTPAVSLSKENLEFFSNDEDLFADDTSLPTPETAAVEDIVESETVIEITEPVAEPEPKTTGRRFKVFKTPVQDDPADDLPDPVMQATKQEQDRIVVIRNSSGDDMEIPLAEELATDAKKDAVATS